MEHFTWGEKMSPNLETVVVKQLRLLSAGEVASVLGVKPKTVQSWRAAGEGPPHIKAGRRLVRYDPGELVLWMKERRRPDSPSPTGDAA